MTAVREALILPGLFLSATLLGGLHPGSRVVWLTPSLVVVVLGVLLVGTLARGGVLAAGHLVNGRRTALENASGSIVLLSLAAASAQVFNAIVPDTGLLHVLFITFFFIQVLTTMAGTSGPRQLLRSLGVLLTGAFVLRWVVLETLYAPATGTAKRMLTLLLEGVSLGAIDYEPHGAAAGYVALLAIGLYLVGLWLLAASRHPGGTAAIVPRHRDAALRTGNRDPQPGT